jgi:hypothetical protein
MIAKKGYPSAIFGWSNRNDTSLGRGSIQWEGAYPYGSDVVICEFPYTSPYKFHCGMDNVVSMV